MTLIQDPLPVAKWGKTTLVDQVPAICGVIVGLLTLAFLYDKVTKKIPTRLAEESPKARFELVPASTYSTPAPRRGIEYVGHPRLET